MHVSALAGSAPSLPSLSCSPKKRVSVQSCAIDVSSSSRGVVIANSLMSVCITPDGAIHFPCFRAAVRSEKPMSHTGSPPDPGLQRSRVSIAVYLDLVECVGDLAQVVCGEFDAGPAQVLFEPMQLGRSRDRHDPRLLG